MDLDFLDFEQPIAELKAKIHELRHMGNDSELNLAEEIQRLEAKSEQLTQRIFSQLTTAQVVQLARHPQRPYTSDYVKALFTDVDLLEGDRAFASSHAIMGGMARFEGRAIMFIGHEKGRNTKEKIKHNFGMPRPEGYRKALRLMKLAEKFSLPVVTFIDTPGAHAGVSAEEHNQSEAIARNLFEMAQLQTPIVSTVIGEGGSGGALAIGLADRVAMLQHAIYSVISPEGCASILWKSAAHSGQAAEAMGVTSQQILAQGLIEHVIEEPLGGAHCDVAATASAMRGWLSAQLDALQALPVKTLLQQRRQRYLQLGVGE